MCDGPQPRSGGGWVARRGWAERALSWPGSHGRVYIPALMGRVAHSPPGEGEERRWGLPPRAAGGPDKLTSYSAGHDGGWLMVWHSLHAHDRVRGRGVTVGKDVVVTAREGGRTGRDSPLTARPAPNPLTAAGSRHSRISAAARNCAHHLQLPVLPQRRHRGQASRARSYSCAAASPPLPRWPHLPIFLCRRFDVLTGSPNYRSRQILRTATLGFCRPRRYRIPHLRYAFHFTNGIGHLVRARGNRLSVHRNSDILE